MIDGLEADVVTLALAYDIDAIAEKSGRIAKDWQKRLPDNSVAVHVDDRVRRAQGQPARASTTGTIWSSRASAVVTPNPKTSGGARWNYLGGLGLRAARRTAATRPRRSEFVTQALQERAGARLGRARLDDDLRPARHRPRADVLGERGLPAGQRAREGQVRDRRSRASASSPSRRSPSSTRTSTSTARARSPRPTSSSSTRDEGQEPSAQDTTTARATPPRRARTRRRSPRSSCSRSTRCSAAGRRRRPRTSPTAGSSTRSTSRAHDVAAVEPPRVGDARADARQPARASGCRSASRVTYAVAARPHPARGAGLETASLERAGAGAGGAVAARARGLPPQLRRGARRRRASTSCSALLIAWVLARYRFPGRALVDAMVDLPFALPTAVAGIALTTLYCRERLAGPLPRAARHQGRVRAARAW